MGYRQVSDIYNRESGFGQYDVMLEPCQSQEPAFILEFKVFNPDKENDLKDTMRNALKQIEDKKYAEALQAKGIQKMHPCQTPMKERQSQRKITPQNLIREREYQPFLILSKSLPIHL